MTEKSKGRFDLTAEELERILLQKEGESFKDTGVHGRSPGGKRVIGKAVAKGGLLLKGKNPGNVCDSYSTCFVFTDGQACVDPETRGRYPHQGLDCIGCLPQGCYRDTGLASRVLQFPAPAYSSCELFFL